jgi:hypothetical protein
MSFDKILDHAIKNNLNVLLRGRHGVGKTAMIKQAFNDAGLRWKYYSAPTMDPWVDFIGVPKEKTDEKGNTYLDLVRPKDLALDEVDAVFFDELNRAHKKIRNAVLELTQFKSINGKPFNNLKIVWAAVNPDDEEGTNYDVDKLDDAQLDRFEYQIDIPYKPDAGYFKTKYGTSGTSAVKWWMDQKQDIKNLVSPRRLDYALSVMTSGGDVRYVLNPKVNAGEFASAIAKGDPSDILNELIGKKPEEVKKYFLDNNSLKHVKKTLLTDQNNRYLRALAHHLPEEELLNELSTSRGQSNNKFQTFVSNNAERFEHIMDVMLSNKAAYSEIVTRAFEAHKQRKQDRERQALKVSKDVLNEISAAATFSSTKTQADSDMVTIDGKSFKASDLNVDNYLEKTGRRFRASVVQTRRINDGSLTREDAFREFINTIKRSSNIF